MNGGQRNEHVLLIEGAKSYPEALAAISEFRNAVVITCQEAVNEQLASISRALGRTISRKEVRERRRPEKLDTANGPDGESASLGVVIRDDARGLRHYYHLSWWKGHNLGVSASLRFLKKPILAPKMCAALRKARPSRQYRVEQEDDEVYLMRQVVPEDMARLPIFFRELILEWTRLWQVLGGVRAC